MVTYPKDWTTYDFGSYFSILPNNTFSRAVESSSGSVANIHYGDVLVRYRETIDTRTSIPRLVSSVEFKTEAFLQPNDVVFADTAEDETVGKCTQLISSKTRVVAGLHTIPCRPNVATAPGFLGYYLNSSLFHDQLTPYITGIKVSSISKASILKTTLTVPGFREQRAIADVLSGFDEHLANLDQLIAKKKAIRDGAIDELVTGCTRIADYRDPWVKISFEEAIQPKARIGWQGLKAEEYLSMGCSYLISGTDFDSGTIAFDNISFVSRARYELDPNIQVRPGDVLVTKDGTIGKVARVPQLNKPATLNSGVFVFRPNAGLSREFLYWVLMSPVFERFIDTLAAGSTIKHLYQKDLKEFTFMAPPSLSEQTAIAEILSDASEEIRLLEKERTKIELLKLGAMDDLLTGRVRLPIEEEAA